jgi:hypothetical protein
MLLALITNLKWDKLDYKPIQQQALQCISPQLEQLPNTKALKSSTDIPLNDASPINVARLYATSIHEDKLNPICTKDNSASVAKVIWNWLSNNDPVLMPFYINLNRLWSDQRTQHKTDQIHMTWNEFNSQSTNDDKPSKQNNHDLFTFLDSLKQLEPNGLSYTQQELVIPGNAAKKHRKHLKRWICADWLEQLVFHWLVDAGIPQRAIARNLRSGDSSNSSSQREADLFIHHNARSSIIEVKADMPEGKELKDLEQQLTSLRDRFGRTQKILFIGPHLSQKLHNPAKLESFQLRCLASGV